MVPWVDWASGCSSRLRRITRATIAAPKAANPNHFFLEAMRQEYAVLRWEGATRSCQQDKTLPATSCPQETTADARRPSPVARQDAASYQLPARNDARCPSPVARRPSPDKTLPATRCPQEKTPDKTLPATRYPLPARNDARRGSQFPVSSKKRLPQDAARGQRAADSR